MMKQCNKCHLSKPLSEFYSDSSKKDGYHTLCKSCSNTNKIKNKTSNHERYKKYFRDYYATPRGRYNSYRSCASQRDISFDLSFDQFTSFWENNCSYCGKAINGIGLDRINSSLGYNLENTIPCCSICNTMKLSYTYEEWIAHMKMVLKHLEEI